MTHLWTNLEVMHAWAHGNFLLLASSVGFVFISIWDMGLIMKYPEFMLMPVTHRTLPFGVCIIFITYWYTLMIAEVVKIWKGADGDSFGEIIIAFVLWI